MEVYFTVYTVFDDIQVSDVKNIWNKVESVCCI